MRGKCAALKICLITTPTTDILTQVSAIKAALDAFNKELLANHIKTCVAENIKQDNYEVIDELVVTLKKLMK